jgi:hypothetical protein
LCIKDDKVHGEYVRDFLIARLLTSLGRSVIMGLLENAHWRAKYGGACSAKIEQRPAQEAI